MRGLFFTITVSALGLIAAPVSAAGDLPFTPAFAQAVGSYRDCVLGHIDNTQVAKPGTMAATAMTACAAARDAVQAQLASDIRAAHAQGSAASGMATVDPIIAAVALDHARSLVGEASSAAPVIAPEGHIG